MATLAEIRRRIASLRNTQQITKAMEAVAASKLRRAQARALGARPYAERMSEVLSEVASRVSGFRHPFLETRPVQARLLILITADRGLAGGLNVNAQRVALQYLQGGARGSLVSLGRRGRDFFRRFPVPILADTAPPRERTGPKAILPPVPAAIHPDPPGGPPRTRPP